MTPYVADLLSNWKTKVQPSLQSLSTADRLALAKDLESGKASTTCLL